MRTARRVIVCLLLLHAVAGLWAQQSPAAAGPVDSSVTVTGRDDSVIAVPAPTLPDELAAAPGADSTADPPAADASASAAIPPSYPPLADLALPPAREALVLPDRLRPPLQ